ASHQSQRHERLGAEPERSRGGRDGADEAVDNIVRVDERQKDGLERDGPAAGASRLDIADKHAALPLQRREAGPESFAVLARPQGEEIVSAELGAELLRDAGAREAEPNRLVVDTLQDRRLCQDPDDARGLDVEPAWRQASAANLVPVGV